MILNSEQLPNINRTFGGGTSWLDYETTSPRGATDVNNLSPRNIKPKERREICRKQTHTLTRRKPGVDAREHRYGLRRFACHKNNVQKPRSTLRTKAFEKRALKKSKAHHFLNKSQNNDRKICRKQTHSFARGETRADTHAFACQQITEEKHHHNTAMHVFASNSNFVVKETTP